MDADASFVWSYGSDHGHYTDWGADACVKDLSMTRVRAACVLLAYEVNGEPLPAQHGFPVRLFVPGFYGTKCVKWLCRIEVTERRAPCILLTTRLYNDHESLDDGTNALDTVWKTPPDTIVVSPRHGERVRVGEFRVWGQPWSADGVSSVDLSLDGGTT